MRILAISAVFFLLPVQPFGSAQGQQGFQPLPEGLGLAAKFPCDVAIGKHADVLFHDDFEDVTNPEGLNQKWDGGVHHLAHIRIATEKENVHFGRKSVEFTIPKQEKELANKISKALKEEKDLLFLRWYSKFQAGFEQLGSSHNGATISSHYQDKNGQATAGKPADGKNKWLVCCENWRNDPKEKKPGQLNAYIYWPEQYSGFGDHFFPSGTVLPNSSARSGSKTFGKEFVSRDDITQELDRWYCYEFMVKANTPGKRDGRIAFWLDGRLVADFTNVRLRDVPELKIDRFGMGLHIGHNTIRENRKYYDDVVAATSYIGPMVTPKKK